VEISAEGVNGMRFGGGGTTQFTKMQSLVAGRWSVP